MASLMHLVTGRKRECTVWQHFEYLEGKKKSKCFVVDESGKMCGFEVAGKNPTNLKGHLNTRHKNVYAEVCGKEQDRKHSLKRKRDDGEAGYRKSDSVPKAGSSQHPHLRHLLNVYFLFADFSAVVLETECPSLLRCVSV